MRKKTVAIATDFPLSNTGLARNGKALLKYLYKTGKYDIKYFATGLSWSAPENKKLPVDCYGATPDNRAELAALQNDPAKLRDASYGALKIDEFLQTTKPDILILSNDSWAFPYQKKSWWNKIHVLPHITIDSLPMTDDQISLAKSVPQMLVWAKFAEEEYQKAGIQNIETVPAIIENEYFYPLPKDKKLELRQKFGIDPDTFITGFVFRSQPRKEVKPLLQGFAQFRKEFPKARAKLLLHTNFSEGWDIPRLMKDCGVNQEDVLTTYICRQCNEYEVKPYTGQDLDCRFCGFEKSQITTNVYNGVSESQLNEIYNLMDCYCHLANAGGCEMPIIEALYAGLPLGTVSYSFGKTFTDEPFVTEIDCAYTVQHQTQFNRAVPNPYSVFKFLKKIYNMDESARKVISDKGRSFALNAFSPEVVGKKWTLILDNLPPIDYDFNFTQKQKNPDYPMPTVESDDEFLTLLYENVLFQPEPQNGDGRKHWLEVLSRGVAREEVYRYFIKVALEDNEKNKKIELTDLFDQSCKTALFVCGGEYEDLFWCSTLLESARKTYSGHKIYFAAQPQFSEILEGNPNIDHIISYLPVFENEAVMTGHGNIDGPVDVVIIPKKNFKPESSVCSVRTKFHSSHANF
jgi:glycosyltransferase involved in cell wall biosynthesis